jgi:hypothetical protein
MTRAEMLATYFVHDGGDTSQWRLKGHAEDVYWQWVCKWAKAVEMPSDLGFSDDGYILPELIPHSHVIERPHDIEATGTLFAVEAQSMTERRREGRITIAERVAACAELVNASSEQWIVWCQLNDEGDALEKAIPDAVQVSGTDKDEFKTSTILKFIRGEIRVVVTKPSIFGFGENLQNCHNMAFASLNDSWEQQFQAVRRCWRFGQVHPVHVHRFYADTQAATIRNLDEKQAKADTMSAAMKRWMMADEIEDVTSSVRDEFAYRPTKRITIPTWLRSVYRECY